jgi:DNA polymerase-3 subunit epsilon
VQISRRTWNIRPTKLSDVCRKLKIALNHHEALSDAMACAQIVLAANKQPATGAGVRRRNSAAKFGGQPPA